MNDNDLIFGKLPDWLRWVLVLPVAVLASLILPLLSWISAQYVTGMLLDNLFFRIITMAISAFGFLFGLFYCVPRFKSVIAAVASILLSIYFAIFALFGILDGWVWETIIVNGVSGVTCIYLTVRFLLDKAKVDEEQKQGAGV